jgi:hypothetical protein
VVEQQPGIEPGSRAKASRQATALADLSVAEAGERLVLDWNAPNRHATFYKSVFRAAVLRANRRPAEMGDPTAAAEVARLTPHVRESVHHGGTATAGGRPVHGHAKVTTTLGVYAHLFNTDDHTDAMMALGATEDGPVHGENVVPLHG